MALCISYEPQLDSSRILNDPKLLVVLGKERRSAFRVGTLILSSSFLERRGNKSSFSSGASVGPLSTLRTQPVSLIELGEFILQQNCFL